MSTVVERLRASRHLARPLMSARWSRGVLLGVLVAFLLLLMFRGYFSGSTIPPWDFLGGYNTDAYQWWTEGTFFSPLEWSPSAWGGFPVALNIQNSAWYLPVGIASAFGPFTLHSAAVVAALHVALGFFGIYFLCRSLGITFPVASVIATAGFFGVGYFSNAQHVDIARSYALIPWVLIVLSPTWPWKRIWGFAVAVLILWQSITGMYPGILVATVYVGLVWVTVSQWRARPRFREYLLPLVIAFTAALLLCLPRLLPYFLVSDSVGGMTADGSLFAPAMIGTLLYGYSSAELPNDISMRSFFVPATVLVLAFFARLRHPVTVQALALAIPAVFLGLPFFPWFSAAQYLPGLGLSRFTMSDFKVFLILSILLFAASGLSALLAISPQRTVEKRVRVGLALGGLLVVAMVVVGEIGPFTYRDWAPGAAILGTVYLAVASFVVIRLRKKIAGGRLVATLLILTVLSGYVWAFTTPVTWRTERVAAETVEYGAPVSELITSHRTSTTGEQRPARIAPPAGFDLVQLRDVFWNRVVFTGEAAVGGYTNLKGQLTATDLEQALLDPTTGAAFTDFFEASGRAVTSTTDSYLSQSEMISCGLRSLCGDATVVPNGYRPGTIDYKVSAPQSVHAIFNEPYYEGWSLKVCTSEKNCTQLAVQRDKTGLIQATLPQGQYIIELNYETPGRVVGWVLFWMGIIVVFVATFVLRRPHSLKKADTP